MHSNYTRLRFRKSHRKNGFTLVELLVYIVLMTIVLGALTYFTSQIYGIYSSMTAESKVDQAAHTLAQVLATELRAGREIDQSQSTFNVPNGVLTIDSRSGSEEVVKRFEVFDGRIQLTQDAESFFLTPEDITVSKFLFTQVTTPVSYAIRYEIDFTFTKDNEQMTKTYPGMVILRHSYE